MAACKNWDAEKLLQAGMAPANAEVAALMKGFAVKRKVPDLQNLEKKRRVQATRALSHTSGEQNRLKQSHL